MARVTRSTQEPWTIADDLVPLRRWGTEQRERGPASASGVPVPIASTIGPVSLSRPVNADVLREAGFIEEVVEDESSADTIRAPQLSIQDTQSGNTAPIKQAPGIVISVTSSERFPTPTLSSSVTAVPAERVKHAGETHFVFGDELKGRAHIFACDLSMQNHWHQYYWQT